MKNTTPTDIALPIVTIFGHAWCHLCAKMQIALESLAQPLGFTLELVDIEGNEELEARFGELVPVVFCAGQEVCHYFLDESKLAQSLARERR